MQNVRPIGVTVLIVALTALTLWLLYPGAAEWSLASPGAVAAVGDGTAPIAADAAASTAATESTAGEVERVAVGGAPLRGDADGLAFVGRVVDDRGEAIAGAAVVCMPQFGGEEMDPSDYDPVAFRERAQREKSTTTTDADGRFRVRAAATQQSWLQLRARRHVGLQQTSMRPSDGDRDLGNLVLRRGAVVRGRVVDLRTAPVAGAGVYCTRKDQASGSEWELPQDDAWLDSDSFTKTDAEGCFELAHVEPGEIVLFASDADHPTVRRDDLRTAVDDELENIVLTLGNGATIRGRALGLPAEPGKFRVLAGPVRGGSRSEALEYSYAMIGDFAFESPSTDRFAELDGDAFVLRGLRPDRQYRVWLAQASSRSFGYGFQCSEPSEVRAGTNGVELRYEPGITINCRVVAAQDGKPVERLWVRDELQGDRERRFRAGARPRKEEAYADGRVTIGNVRPGKKDTLRLTIDAVGYQQWTRKDIALPAAGTLDLGEVRLQRTQVVRVTVVAAADQQPIAGITVRSRQPRARNGAPGEPGGSTRGPQSGKTDADGKCVLNANPGKPNVVAISNKDWAPYESEPLTIQPNEDAEHRVLLVRGGTVKIAAFERDVPVVEVGIEHRPPAGDRRGGATDKSGQAVFAHLVPGEHQFRVAPRGRRAPAESTTADWKSVTVVEGATATLRLERPPGASVRGLVRENGLALAAARVVFAEGTGQSDGFGFYEGRGSAKTGDDGSYAMQDLPAGEHRLRVTHPSRAMAATVAIVLRVGENMFDIDLERTIVRGLVVDSQGKGVAGASVTAREFPRPQGTPARGEETNWLPMPPGQSFEGSPGPGQAKTGSDGSFEIRGVAAGVPLQLRARAKGFVPGASKSFEVVKGATTTAPDIQLAIAGQIRITVAGAPSMVNVRATLEGGDGADGTSVSQMLRQGTGTLEGLRPGQWKVRVTRPGEETGAPRVVEVVAGGTATADF